MKDIERALLRSVYDTAAFETVLHQDKPDFLLSYRNRSGFGVEITEVYESESEARLQNIDGYMQELWDGKPHRHKDDIEILKTGPATLLDKDGNVKATDLPIVMVNVTNLPSLPSLIADAIRRKESRFDEYAKGLTHVNLIIHDRTRGPAPKVGEVFESRALVSEDVRSALNESRFAEVFVVATSDDNKQVFRPLRALLLGEIGYGFMRAMNAEFPEPVEMEDDDILMLFFETCKGLGVDLNFVRDGQGSPVAYFGGVGIRFGSESITILEASSLPLPSTCDPPEFQMPRDRAMQLIGNGVRFFSNMVFSSAYGYPAVTPFLETIETESA